MRQATMRLLSCCTHKRQSFAIPKLGLCFAARGAPPPSRCPLPGNCSSLLLVMRASMPDEERSWSPAHRLQTHNENTSPMRRLF